MKLIYFVLLLIGLAAGKQYDGLRMTYGLIENSSENFFKIPRTVEEAKTSGDWRKTESAPGPMKQITTYCWQGNYVCLLFAASEFITGVQFAFPADDLDVAVIDLDTWFTKWRVASGDGEPAKEYRTIALYFASEEFLAAGGPEAANGSTLQDNGVWVYDKNRKLLRIPLTEAEIRDTTPFTKQNCIPKMGTHYQYNLTREMRCDTQLPWFGFTRNGELIGVGLQFFGKLRNYTLTDRVWFEVLEGARLLKIVIPHGPDCLYEHADAHPAMGIHVYFVDNPVSTKCRDEDSIDPSTIPDFLRNN